MKKLPGELELDQLLKALTEANDEQHTETPEYDDDILGFMNKFSIKTGDQKVSSPLLYSLYKQWSSKPIKRNAFTIRLKNLFEGKFEKIDNVTFFFINKESRALAPEVWDFFKKYKKRSVTKQINLIKHFDSFRTECKIKPGNRVISATILYYIYLKWTTETKKRSIMKPDNFFKFCRLFFKTRNIKYIGIGYLISDSIFEYIPKERVDQMTEERLRGKEKKEQKK